MFRSSMKAAIGVKEILDEAVVWWLSNSILELYPYQLKRIIRQSEKFCAGAYAI